MKVLITGGSGFLGERLVDRLLKENHEVFLLHRSERPQKRDGCTYVQANITDAASLQNARQTLPAIDTIVHMAALVPTDKSEDNAVSMFEVNVKGTINVLETFGEGVRNFVYASTAEVYGLPRIGGLINEETPAKPLSYYGASKLAGEQFCNVYASRHDLAVSMLRFTVLYGSGDRINRAVPNFIKKALRGEDLEVFGGEELRDYLHVTDAAEAIYLAATKSPKGTFNIGTGQGISIRDTATAIVNVVDPTLSANILPREKPAADIVLDISQATQELGFKPQHIFPELIEEQVTWHKQNP